VVIHNGDKGYETTNKGTSAQDKDDLTAYLSGAGIRSMKSFACGSKIRRCSTFYDGMAIVDGKPTDPVTLLTVRRRGNHLPDRM